MHLVMTILNELKFFLLDHCSIMCKLIENGSLPFRKDRENLVLCTYAKHHSKGRYVTNQQRGVYLEEIHCIQLKTVRCVGSVLASVVLAGTKLYLRCVFFLKNYVFKLFLQDNVKITNKLN